MCSEQFQVCCAVGTDLWEVGVGVVQHLWALLMSVPAMSPQTWMQPHHLLRLAMALGAPLAVAAALLVV